MARQLDPWQGATSGVALPSTITSSWKAPFFTDGSYYLGTDEKDVKPNQTVVHDMVAPTGEGKYTFIRTGVSDVYKNFNDIPTVERLGSTKGYRICSTFQCVRKISDTEDAGVRLKFPIGGSIALYLTPLDLLDDTTFNWLVGRVIAGLYEAKATSAGNTVTSRIPALLRGSTKPLGL